MTKKLEELRRIVADYMQSEGCGCCCDYAKHREDRAKLAQLLEVPGHPEEPDFFDFSPYQTDQNC